MGYKNLNDGLMGYGADPYTDNVVEKKEKEGEYDEFDLYY